MQTARVCKPETTQVCPAVWHTVNIAFVPDFRSLVRRQNCVSFRLEIQLTVLPAPRRTGRNEPLSQSEIFVPSDRKPRSQCPICDGAQLDPKLRLTRQGESFEIVSCHDCGFIFVADPEADTANHIDINKIGWAFRPRHSQIRRLLLSRLSPGQKIIEIGCGRGEVGFLMRGDPLEYAGYEPARGLSDFGIRAGVPIIQRTFEGDQRADAIVIDNVLEHVAEPAKMLEIAASALNPGGILIAITPNVNDIRALSPEWQKRHLWVPPDHINFFSAKDIDTMFARTGMFPKRFKFDPLTLRDWKFYPRALAETIGLSIFGHNVYSIKTC
jgi:SAM-dependent methyltransferase